MMLPDSDQDKLCYGRIIYADGLFNSFGTPAKPHYVIMMEPDNLIKQNTEYYVLGISNNDKIDEINIMPVPAYTGLTGYICGSWDTTVHLAGIVSVHPAVLHAPDMIKVERLLKTAIAGRKIKKKSTRN